MSDMALVLDEGLDLRLSSASLLLLRHTLGCTSEDDADHDHGKYQNVMNIAINQIKWL